MTAKKTISVEEFDKLFDEGHEDIMDYLDLDKAEVINANKSTESISVSFPLPIMQKINKYAQRMNVSNEEVVKFWVSERIAQDV